jgi:hypothetical protein
VELVIGPGVKATEKKVRSSLLFADWMKRHAGVSSEDATGTVIAPM